MLHISKLPGQYGGTALTLKEEEEEDKADNRTKEPLPVCPTVIWQLEVCVHMLLECA
jgi:hypothetical protein